MKKYWTFQHLVLLVFVFTMSGCFGGGYSSHRRIYSSDAFRHQPPSVTVNMGQPEVTKSSLSHDEIVARELVRLEKIIEWESPKTKALLNKKFNKNTKGMSFTNRTHYERDRKRQTFLRCEFPKYIAVKHNNNVLKGKCSGSSFIAGSGIYGEYSDYSAMDANSSQARGGNGGGNVMINSNNTTTTSNRSYAPPIGDCNPYWRGYRVRVKWHAYQGWQCHYGGYVMTGSDPYPYGVPYR